MRWFLILLFLFSFIGISFAAPYDKSIDCRRHHAQYIVIKDGKYGIMFGRCKKVLPIEYEYIEESKYNYIVKKEGKYGLFDGYKSRTKIEYDSIKPVALTLGYNYETDYYAVEKDSKIGCIAYDKKTKEYNLMFEIIYDEVVGINDKDFCFAIKKDGKYAIVNPTKNKKIKFVYKNFKKSLDLVKVKRGWIWYYKDPEEIFKLIFKPFSDIFTFFIWHFGSL